MSTYADKAPVVSGTGITEAQVENYFENMPAQTVASSAPVVTKAHVQHIANLKFNNLPTPVVSIAHELGLEGGQVKDILKELEGLYVDWVSQQEG